MPKISNSWKISKPTNEEYDKLTEKVRSEQIRYKKERICKFDMDEWKERVAYVDTFNKTENFVNFQENDFENEENEINLAKLKFGHPYVCQMLKP